MTKKPLDIINTYDLAWVSNDLLYFMSTSIDMDKNKCSLSMSSQK